MRNLIVSRNWYSDDDLNLFENNGQARRPRKAKAQRKPKKSQRDILAELTETASADDDIVMSYKPSKHEKGWLLESLRAFFDQGLISDVEALVKGGKEASVYRVRAHENTGLGWLAAKVYRPRQFRQLRNDAAYREGRVILKSDGSAMKGSDHRMIRALNKKSGFGTQVAHTSWLMYEYTTLHNLKAAGASVPQAYGVSDNAILMTYYGDEQMAAPALSEVELEANEAQMMFRQVLNNIELMLRQGFIHGDLSAYNMLYWEGEAVLIDFPQVVDAHNNKQAYAILERDVERVCDYFVEQGVVCDANAILRSLWRRYVAKDPRLVEADMSRFEVDEA
jgi:RIO kinase 1